MRERAITPQTVSGDLAPNKAWLLGFTAGDGHVLHRVDIRTYCLTLACGRDEQLATYSRDVIKEVYGLDSRVFRADRPPPRTFCWTTTCHSKAVVENMALIAPFGVHRWRVPERVKNGSDEIKAHWLAGIVDADGCVQHWPKKGRRYVAIDSVNPDGMDDVSALMTSLGIDHARYVCRRADADETKHRDGLKIVVGHYAAVKKFAEIVPLRCERKRATLAEAVASYQREDVLREGDVDDAVPEIQRRLADRESYAEIAEGLDLRPEQVRRIARSQGIPTPGRGHGARFQGYEKVWPEVERRLAAGEAVRSVADALGLDYEGLRNAMASRGTKVGKARGRESARGEELAALLPQIKALVEEGLSNPEIAERVGHGLSRTRVANLLSKHGIKRDPSIRWKNAGPKDRRSGGLAADTDSAP